ncbi:hypothetical protein I3843_07G068000 [Carya illinoinensis]|nr:hypothetical protein I3843_07G068000 [Carya illinoinensis]
MSIAVESRSSFGGRWVFVLLLFWRKVSVGTLPPWEERVWLYLFSSEEMLF